MEEMLELELQEIQEQNNLEEELEAWLDRQSGDM